MKIYLLIVLALLSAVTVPAQRRASKHKHRGHRRSEISRVSEAQRLVPLQCRPRVVPDFVWGVTATNIDAGADINAALSDLESAFPNLPAGALPPIMVRVVFDSDETSEDFEASLIKYKAAVFEISQHAYVMGTIADSSAWFAYTRPESEGSTSPHNNYASRMKRFVEEMGDCVQVWEIGNEVNGEWVGWKDDDWRRAGAPALLDKRNKIKAQITDAFDVVQNYNRGHANNPKQTAITLYYNNDSHNGTCFERRLPEYEMFDWSTRYIDREVRANVDYVLLSYYENKEDCPGPKQDAQTFISTFKGLIAETMFTRAKVGFGEVGYKASCPKKRDGEFEDAKRPFNRKCIEGNPSCALAERCVGQQAYIKKYYDTRNQEIISGLAAEHNSHPQERLPQFMGGYFYWYFIEDMVGTKGLGGGENQRRNRATLKAVMEKQ